MKGSASVNPVFESINIYNSHLHSLNPLVVTDPHRIYFLQSANSTKWDHKSIINCCYSQKHGALMLLSQQGKLHIFTQTLQQISRVPWESKYSVGLDYFDQKGMFLMIGATAIEVQYVRIYSNIKSTKFVSSMNFGVEKKQKYWVDSQNKLQWNKGYGYDLKENLLYLWSSKDIHFYNLENLQIKSKITSLTRKDLSITYVLYNTPYKYTITGLINGHVKVWRLPMSNRQQDYILIHNYIRHTKPVESIVQGSDDRVIITCSQELMVCLWSLQTFELLREYDFTSEYSNIILCNGLFSYAIKDGQLGKLKFGKTMQFITDVTSEVISFDKYRRQSNEGQQGKVQSMQVTLASNLGFRIRDDQLDAKDLNKTQIEYIYPPLKAKGILQIISSPHHQNQYYLLVESGEIFKLRIQNGSGKIEQSYSIQRTKDVQSHQLNQIPTLIKFLPIIPPKYDSEINENTMEKKQRKQNNSDPHKSLKLIAIGCNKGTIIFLKTDNIELIYTRVTYHRQAITALESFQSNGYSYLISYCEELYLKIVRFDGDKASCIYSVYTNNFVSSIKGLQDRFALVLKKGFFEIFHIDSDEKEYCIKNTKASDHEEQILCIDDDPCKKILLTAASDNKIKIWSYFKVLLYEIVLDDGLKSASWFRPFEILVSHNLKILYFKNIGFKISSKQIDRANDEFLENEQEGRTNLQSVLQTMKALNENVKFELQLQKKSIEKFPEVKAKQVKPNRKKIQSSYEVGNYSMLQNNPKKQDSVRRYSQQKKKRNSAYQSGGIHDTQEEVSKGISGEKDFEAMKKHLDDMRELRKQTNESVLPKIKPKNEDAFDNFMKSKLINKKVLTRRDITLNRIIMKNIIKEHFGTDSEVVNNLKLDF